MDTDDLAPPPRKPDFVPRQLDPLSIEELAEYIDQLKAEIARTESAMQAKRAQRGAADALFGGSTA